MASLIPIPRMQFFDNNGDPLVGGKVYTKLSGTDNDLVTYTSSSEAVENTNPVILDSRGEADIWFKDGSVYKLIVKTSADVEIYTRSNISQGLYSSKVITTGTTTGRTLPERFKDFVNVKDNGAVPGGVVDSTTAIQNTINDFDNIYIDDVYKTTSTLNVPSGKRIFGNGRTGRIDAYGCDGFEITGGQGDGVTIEGFAMLSYSSGGSPDPRLYSAIYSHGTASDHVNNNNIRDMYIQGFSDSVHWSYTVSSNMDNVYTINCNNGLVYFGQSFNNTLSNCKLVCNSGQASVKIIPDGATVGEGLMISNSLLSSGAYGIDSGTGFNSLQISNCIIDQIGAVGVNVTDCKDLKISNTFIYAGGKCIYFNALGSVAYQNSEITNCTLKFSGSTGTAIKIGNNNYGIAIAYNDFTLTGTTIGVDSDGRSIDISNNNFVNSGSGVSINVGSNLSYHNIESNRGTVTYGGGWGLWTPVDGSGAGLSLTVTNATFTTHGDDVIVHGYVTYPATANGANALLNGLPFTTTTAGEGALSIGYKTSATLVGGHVTGGGNGIRFYDSTGNLLTNAQLSGIAIRFSVTYKRVWG